MKRLIVNSLDVRYERHTVFNKASMVVEAGSLSLIHI